MEGEPFTLFDLFKALESSGARALLIGRQALVLLGLPLHTADIDLWLHADDIETLNRSEDILDPETAEMEERRLSAEEFAALEKTPLAEEEREHLGSLIDWFARRYPTPLERLQYVRSRARELRRMRVHLGSHPGETR